MTHTFTPGSFVQYTMVTDTVVLEVVKATAKTITVRGTGDGEVLHKRNADGNPFPIVYTEAVPAPGATPKTFRLRKDGTFRAYSGGRPIRPAALIDGRPARVTDYRV